MTPQNVLALALGAAGGLRCSSSSRAEWNMGSPAADFSRPKGLNC